MVYYLSKLRRYCRFKSAQFCWIKSVSQQCDIYQLYSNGYCVIIIAEYIIMLWHMQIYQKITCQMVYYLSKWRRYCRFKSVPFFLETLQLYFFLHCSRISRWPAGRASWCSFYFFIFYFLFIFCFKRGFHCWVIILFFSSFSIILFAVDLSFPIFVSKMSVVIFWMGTFIYIIRSRTLE